PSLTDLQELLQPVKPRQRASDSEDEDEGSSAAIAQLSVDGLSSQEVMGAQVFLDEKGSLHWPVLFLYPEHQQSDFISAFCENSCFMDHIAVMFGEELPPWDADRKYHPQNLQVCFPLTYFFDTHGHPSFTSCLLFLFLVNRFFVKGGTPSFIVVVNGSPFTKQFLTGKKTQEL
uniref:Cns1/TTC4 wheel domain-containing protein n=1 Tax=Labrus bergylta TaxID=56723 RepID=A0A3Q3N7D1_9LABR